MTDHVALRETTRAIARFLWQRLGDVSTVFFFLGLFGVSVSRVQNCAFPSHLIRAISYTLLLGVVIVWGVRVVFQRDIYGTSFGRQGTRRPRYPKWSRIVGAVCLPIALILASVTWFYPYFIARDKVVILCERQSSSYLI